MNENEDKIFSWIVMLELKWVVLPLKCLFYLAIEMNYIKL